MKRRRVLAAIGSAGIASTSGCAIATDLFGEDGENNRQPEGQADSSDSPGESREQPTPTETDQESKEDRASMPPVYVWTLEGHTAPEVDGADTYESEFSYELSGDTHRMSTEIPEGLVDYYESRPRHDGEWGRYVSDPHDRLSMLATANYFEQVGETTGEKANHAMRFVQSLEYTRDEIGAGISQYTAYPVETMESTEGDCEDTTLLLAELLDAMNIGSVVLAFYDQQHMALGVLGADSISGQSYQYQGDSYYYAETTAPGWRIGEVPDRLQGASSEIFPIHDSPVLNTGWNARRAIDNDRPFWEFGLEVIAVNNGRAVARDVTVDVTVEQRNGEVFDQGQVEIGQVAPNAGVGRGYTALEAYDGEMRLTFQTVENGQLQDRGTSRWVSPE